MQTKGYYWIEIVSWNLIVYELLVFNWNAWNHNCVLINDYQQIKKMCNETLKI